MKKTYEKPVIEIYDLIIEETIADEYVPGVGASNGEGDEDWEL